MTTPEESNAPQTTIRDTTKFMEETLSFGSKEVVSETMIQDVWIAKMFEEDGVPLVDRSLCYLRDHYKEYTFRERLPALRRACEERGCIIQMSVGSNGLVYIGVSMTEGTADSVMEEMKLEMSHMRYEMEEMRRMICDMYYAPGMPGFVMARESFDKNVGQ